PDGRRETLLSVPNYHFNWQFYFDLAQPIKVPAGSTITNVAHYSNTATSKYNPAPDKDVYWSEQSWDEMYCPFIAYSIDSEAPKKGAPSKPPTRPQYPPPAVERPRSGIHAGFPSRLSPSFRRREKARYSLLRLMVSRALLASALVSASLGTQVPARPA